MFKKPLKAAFITCFALASLSCLTSLQAHNHYGRYCDENCRNNDYDYDYDYNESPSSYRRGYDRTNRDGYYREDSRRHKHSSSQMNERNRYRNDENDFSDNYNDRKNSTSDEELAKKIHDKIAPGYFSEGYKQVRVEVANGVVKLQGMVKTWDEKEKLEKDIRNMDGVRGLKSQLSVDESKNKNQQRSFSQDTAATPMDEQLNKKIRDSVSMGWLWDSYKSVSLHTSKGVVTLEGELNSLDDEQKLVEAIEKIDGVRQVKSNLRIEESTGKEGSYE